MDKYSIRCLCKKRLECGISLRLYIDYMIIRLKYHIAIVFLT